MQDAVDKLCSLLQNRKHRLGFAMRKVSEVNCTHGKVTLEAATPSRTTVRSRGVSRTAKAMGAESSKSRYRTKGIGPSIAAKGSADSWELPRGRQPDRLSQLSTIYPYSIHGVYAQDNLIALQSIGVVNATARHLQQICAREIGVRILTSGVHTGYWGREWMKISDTISFGKIEDSGLHIRHPGTIGLQGAHGRGGVVARVCGFRGEEEQRKRWKNVSLSELSG
ncbi:hypothetical protein B0H14DRAFT_3734713 [Mycena olivaceomarginata]|nr:hypothetical protein B0H14DRAFT_3734713 [Mycena olivaceomarginata]